MYGSYIVSGSIWGWEGGEELGGAVGCGVGDTNLEDAVAVGLGQGLARWRGSVYRMKLLGMMLGLGRTRWPVWAHRPAVQKYLAGSYSIISHLADS